MVSIPALRYASASKRLGSFTAAARECGVTQPTVSAAVADLETFFGIPLFIRGTRQLQATEPGTLLLMKIDAVLVVLGELDDATQSILAPSDPLLRLGFTPLIGAARLGLLLEPFQKANPEIKTLFQESSGPDLEVRLDAGSLDVIFGAGIKVVRNRKSTQLIADPLRFVTQTRAHSGPSSIKLHELSGTRLLLTEDLCGLASATRQILANANVKIDEYPGRAMSYNALEDWVNLGLGAAILPNIHIRNKRQSVSLVDAAGRAINLDLKAVWRKDLLVSDHARKLATYLQKVVPRLAIGQRW